MISLIVDERKRDEPRAAFDGARLPCELSRMHRPIQPERGREGNDRRERLNPRSNEAISELIQNEVCSPALYLHFFVSALKSMERVKGIEPSSQAWDCLLYT